jgi:single-stranded-DNA-specific exonuclease
VSQYAAIASIADCVPLQNGTRKIARLGMHTLGQTHHYGLRELLRVSRADPAGPDSNDLAFGVAPRINAAGRIDHPARALSVFEAARDEDAARKSVERLDLLNQQRRQLVTAHFGDLCTEISQPAPSALVLYRERCPKGIVGLLAAKCVERFGVPSIVLAPSPEPGLAVGSGRSDISDYDLGEGTVPTVTFNDLAEFTYGAAYSVQENFPVALKERVSGGGGVVRVATGTPTSGKNFSCPEGEQMQSRRT